MAQIVIFLRNCTKTCDKRGYVGTMLPVDFIRLVDLGFELNLHIYVCVVNA